MRTKIPLCVTCFDSFRASGFKSKAMLVVISVVVGIILVLLSIIAYLFYRGYGKIKGKALSGELTILRFNCAFSGIW